MCAGHFWFNCVRIGKIGQQELKILQKNNSGPVFWDRVQGKMVRKLELITVSWYVEWQMTLTL